MTEKIMITQEQFEWLERYRSDEEIDYAIDIQIHNKRPDSPIAEWKPSEVARAFYNGYEVALKYKVGEVVRYWRTDCVTSIGNITYIDYEKGLVQFDNCSITKKIHDVTGYATPEEIKAEKGRRLFKDVGRKAGEFKIGDVGRTKHTKFYAYNETDITKLEHHYKHNLLTGFHPAESFISFEEGEEE